MANSTEAHSRIYSPLADDPDLCGLVKLFVDEMPSRVEELLKAYQAKDWESLRQNAHQLRGAAGSYGFESISPSAGELESAVNKKVSEETIYQCLIELTELCRRMSAEPRT